MKRHCRFATLVMAAVVLAAQLYGEEPTLKDSFKVEPAVRSVVFTPDGKSLVIQYAYRIKLRNLASGKETTLAIDRSGNKLAASKNKTLVGQRLLIDVASGNAMFIKSDDLTFSPDGESVVERDMKNRAIVVRTLSAPFDRTTVQSSFIVPGHFQAVSMLPTFSPDGKTLALRAGFRKQSSDSSSPGANTSNTSIVLWDVASKTKVATIAGTRTNQWFDFSSDGRVFALNVDVPNPNPATSFDPRVPTIVRVKLFDVADGTELGTLDEERAGPEPAIFSPDNKVVVAVRHPADNDFIKVWSATTGARIVDLAESPARIHSPLVFSPDSKTIAALCDDRKIRLWDISSAKIIASISAGGTNGTRTAPAISPDGETLAAGCGDSTVKLWTIAR